MTSPEERPHNTGDPGEGITLLSWLQTVADQNVPTALGPAKVPIAWVGRTSTEDNQDPTLSLPRQLDASRHALPDEFVIVAHFYDVESGRTLEELRGRGHGHEQFDIPIPRDGGIAALLDEARRPDRRFVAVICESIERVARTTYLGTKIEHELEQAGLALLAADEGVDRRTIPALAEGSGPVKRATPTLTRRVKQAISEWYVLNMLELAWGGFKAHTDQGFNIGKPPYGYQAKQLRHPVEAKALQGRHKHKLIPDPACGPVVTQIFQWRALERLSYQAIADRLNLYPDRYPPPEPIPGRGRRRIGAWASGSVREVLDNPKHTGYMVWNRRKNPRKARGVKGQVNPPHQWVWSRQPTHEPLVTRKLFEAASTVGRFRQGSRPEPGTNSHPKTIRSYQLRSYLYCDLCNRRMWGGTKRTVVYYHCKKTEKNHGHLPWYGAHPGHVIVREDLLLTPIARFFGERVFGTSRKTLLQDTLPATRANTGLDARVSAIQAELADLQQRQTNLLRELERFAPSGDPDFDDAWRNGIQARFAANAAEQRTKKRLLTDLTREQQDTAPPDLGLLDTLPVTATDVTLLPEDQQRRLYDAFHLEVRYDLPHHALILRVTIDAETAHALHHTVNEQTRPADAPTTTADQPPRAAPASATSGWDALGPLPGARVRGRHLFAGKREPGGLVIPPGARAPDPTPKGSAPGSPPGLRPWSRPTLAVAVPGPLTAVPGPLTAVPGPLTAVQVSVVRGPDRAGRDSCAAGPDGGWPRFRRQPQTPSSAKSRRPLRTGVRSLAAVGTVDAVRVGSLRGPGRRSAVRPRSVGAAPRSSPLGRWSRCGACGRRTRLDR